MHGAKLAGLPGVGGQARRRGGRALSRRPVARRVKQMPPKALSISQVTECGTVYSLEEIAALSGVCRAQGLALHMDGARFANALVPSAASAGRDDLEGAASTSCPSAPPRTAA